MSCTPFVRETQKKNVFPTEDKNKMGIFYNRDYPPLSSLSSNIQ